MAMGAERMGPACGRHGGAGGLWKACDRLAMAPWVHVRAGARLRSWPAGKPATSQEEAGEPGGARRDRASGHLVGSCVPLSGHGEPCLQADTPAHSRRALYRQSPRKQDCAVSTASPKITPLFQQQAKYGSLSFGLPSLLGKPHKIALLKRSIEKETSTLLECWRVLVTTRPLTSEGAALGEGP